MKAIGSIPKNSRPREKMLRDGVDVLTTAELFAALLGTGTTKFPLHTLSTQLARLAEETSSVPDLISAITNLHLGVSHSTRLLAMLELTKRLHNRETTSISNPSVALAYVHELRKAKQERITCLYLDARNRVVHQETLCIGSLNQALLSPRDIFVPIQRYPVTGIVLVHNHPSGDPEPSKDDHAFTERVKKCCELLNLELVDHLIVTKEKYVSWKERFPKTWNA